MKRPREENGGHELAERPRAVYPRGLEVPDGWEDCPPFGTPIEGTNIVPIKAPLSAKFDRVIAHDRRFTPQDALGILRSRNIVVGLVLDLTNTSRYYDGEEWEEMGIPHKKIHCRGQGEVPEPEAVNLFCWEVISFNQMPDSHHKHVVVHCTHGFNRTGYMICNYLVRMGRPCPEAVRLFAVHRHPGIYKDDYLEALFKYTHFQRPSNLPTPPLPQWKGIEGSPEPDAEDQEQDGLEAEMHHDDVLGESVSQEEAELVQQSVMSLVTGNTGASRNPHFPGSQPVSLARDNLELLLKRRYWVTWKADGTRYLLLICKWGSYLIDRSFNVRRVQMRFPSAAHPLRKGGAPRKVHAQHMTLMDGEMIVDEDVVADRQSRRYLAYDLIALDGPQGPLSHPPLSSRPFKERWGALDIEVMKPRELEKQSMAQAGARFVYVYQQEPFRVRRKDFWPLSLANKLLTDFIPSLPHEADGLILQDYEGHYAMGTCPDLLKWKFAHLNSVDFMLQIEDSGKMELLLLETRGGQRHLRTLDGGKVDMTACPDPLAMQGHIIECSFDHETGTWVYMRERKDKDMPNAFHVFEKVMRSIRDNITPEVLLEHAGVAMKETQYAKDVQLAEAARKRH